MGILYTIYSKKRCFAYAEIGMQGDRSCCVDVLHRHCVRIDFSGGRSRSCRDLADYIDSILLPVQILMLYDAPYPPAGKQCIFCFLRRAERLWKFL